MKSKLFLVVSSCRHLTAFYDWLIFIFWLISFIWHMMKINQSVLHRSASARLSIHFCCFEWFCFSKMSNYFVLKFWQCFENVLNFSNYKAIGKKINSLPPPQTMTKNLNITYFTVSIQFNHEKQERLLRAPHYADVE